MGWIIIFIVLSSILGYVYYRLSEDVGKTLMTLMTDGKKPEEEGGDDQDMGTDNFPFIVGDHHLSDRKRTCNQK